MNDLELQPSSFSDTTYVSDDGKRSLTISRDQSYLDYFNSNNASTTNFSSDNYSLLETSVSGFLSSIGINIDNFSEDPRKTSYFYEAPGTFEYDLVDTPSEANIIRTSYQLSINKLPVFINSGGNPNLELDITKSGVLKAKLTTGDFDFEETDSLPVISIQEALYNIENGHYVFINKLFRTSKTGDQKLKSLDLSSFEIVYRTIKGQDLLIPFFDFSGEAVLADDTRVKTKISTPAIKTDIPVVVEESHPAE